MSRLAGTGVQSRPYLLRLILQTDPSAASSRSVRFDARLPSVDASNQFIHTEGNGTPSGVFIANDGVPVYNEQIPRRGKIRRRRND